MTDLSHERLGATDAGRPVPLSHLIHTLIRYIPAMLLTFAAVMIGYLLVAMTLYLLAPSQRVTSMPFRLDFEGATKGEYPNGTKFLVTDIVEAPILLKVYRDNQLSRYVGFPTFSRSVFVLESNAAYDALYADYQARMSDPRLSPLDRERLTGEFNLKRQSLSKSDYSINYVRSADQAAIPENIARKMLTDTLRTWAEVAVKEQHVTLYKVPVFSPQLLEPSGVEKTDPIMAAQMLRANAVRVINNIESLRLLPAADLARSEHERLSLVEVHLRLEDIIRFRLEPLFATARPTPNTARFLETQLSYDQRELDATTGRASAVRDALALYAADGSTRDQVTTAAATTTAPGTSRPSGTNARNDEGVTPQLSEGFLDRLVDLANKSTDRDYRQRLADEYRAELALTVPQEQAVAWDKQALELVRAGGGTMDPAAALAQVDTARTDIQRLMGTVLELYQVVSRNLSPETELYTGAGTPYTRIERAASIRRFALVGVLVMLASIPLIVIGALLHNRVREEEAEEVGARA